MAMTGHSMEPTEPLDSEIGDNTVDFDVPPETGFRVSPPTLIDAHFEEPASPAHGPAPHPGQRVDLPPPTVGESGSAAPYVAPDSVPAPGSGARPPAPVAASARPAWCWGALHGGAGVDTLNAAVPGGVAEWWAGWPFVLVCRSTWNGLQAARAWAGRSDVDRTGLLGLVIVADLPRGRLPKRMADEIVILHGGYPRVWQLPFVMAWRSGDTAPAPQTAPRQYAALGADLATLVGMGS